VPPLIGATATEAVVRSQLPSARYIHLATHAQVRGGAASRESYIALASGSGHDGLLTVAELLEDDSLRFVAELLVLSACQTALGEIREGEGIIGFQRALLTKGVRSMLVSLWNVDDEATRQLMQSFLRHWLGLEQTPAAPDKAEALRRAQSELRDGRPTSAGAGSFAHPRYWAAFQLVGAR
jgi:CHAT domain-containing protein